MSFFSGLGNIFHGIANFFEGGDDERKKQQQAQLGGAAPISHALSSPQNYFQPQNNDSPGPAQPQKQDPFVNLLQPNGNTNLVKAGGPKPMAFAAPTPVPQAAPQAPPQPHASIIHDITHNPVTNVVGGVAKGVAAPFEYLAKADIINPTRELLDSGNPVAEANANRQSNIDLGLGPQGTDFGGGLKKWGGNSAGALLTVAAPGLESGIESGTGAVATKLLGDTGAEDFIPAVTKYGNRFLTGGTLNTGLSASQEFANGMSTGDILKKAPGQFAVGGAIGEAAPPVLGGLRKFAGKYISALSGDPNVAAPDELATGVKSANPVQSADAAAVHAQQAQPPISVEQAPATELQKAATDLSAPAYQRAPLKVAAANEAAAARAAGEEQVAPTQPTDAPAFQHKQAVQSVIEQGNQELTDYVNQHPEATPQDIETAKQSIGQQVTEKITQLNNARYGVSGEGSGNNQLPIQEPQTPVAPQPAGTSPTLPSQDLQPSALPIEPQPPTPQPAVLQGSPEPAPQGTSLSPQNTSLPDSVAQTPNNVNPAGAPNGGLANSRFNQAVIDNTKDPVFKEAFESDPIEKTGAPLSELNEQAIAKVNQMSLPELAMNYGKDFEAGHSPVTSPSQYYEGLQALRQLEQYAGDPTAAEAAANTLRAVNEFASQQGRGLAATKVAYDNLPTSMKVAYIQKIVEKAGGSLNAADLERLYSAAELQGKFAKTAADAANAASELSVKAPEADPKFNDNMKELLKTEMEAKTNLHDQNRDVVDIINKNLPASSINDRFAQSARTMMLSSVGGRAFALTSTGSNFVNYAADKTLSSVFGRAINGVNRLRGAETPAVKTSFIRPSTVVKGAVRGVKGLAKETFGKAPVKDVEQAVQGKFYDNEYSHDSTRYGKLGGVTSPLRKVVRFGVGSHLALTKGVEDVELEQAARQAASEVGVPKSNQKGFIDYYKQHAPRNVAEEAKQVHLGVNNLHKNGWSDKVFGNIADGLDKIPVLGKTFRTAIMPFSRFMGGYVDKALTDRNMFYNMYRIARARSPQELSDNLARLVTNVGSGVGIGYLGAKSGLITDKDANGDSYDGLYFHVGNRYIPVAIAGQTAAPIIMGASFHQTLNGPGGLTKWPTDVADKLAKATGVAGTFGSDTGPNQVFTGNSSKGAPALAGTVVRQHIPGFFGDINSGLDYSSLNPTHEAALTKATNKNPATGKQVTDSLQTEVNKTKATIPGVAQSLPRKAGVQAHDFLDRVLHSNQSSSTQLQKAKDDKVVADQATADKQADIPNPAKGAYDGTGDTYAQALQARIERGEYDKVIASLQQDAKQQQNDKNVAPSTLRALDDKVKQFTVAKGAKLSYSDMQLYNSTSLSEWRQLGNPKSDTYDPDTYQKLWNMDKALADQGVAGAFGIDKTTAKASDKQKYSAKAASTASGRSSSNRAARNAASLVKGNTIGSTPEIKSISFGDLSPIKLDNFKIPTIQKIPADQLVKKRTISVTKA